LSQTILIVRRIGRDVIKNYIGLHVKYTLLSDIKKPCIFSTEFRKILKYEISRKLHFQLESSCSMRTDGRTGGQNDRQTRWSR